MKKAIKIILLVLLFLAVAVGAVFGFRWYTGRQTAAAPVVTEGQQYQTTAPAGALENDADLQDKDDLASDSNIKESTTWPFADRKSDSKFEAKESVGYTTTKAAKKTDKKSSDKTADKTTDKTKKAAKEEEETTKKSSGSSGSARSFLKGILNDATKTKSGHPVKVDSNGIDVEYKNFAVADLNGDGKEEVFLYATSSKGEQFYGNSYIVYDNSLKNVRTTMVVDELKDIKFYKSGVYEIATNKFGFTSDALASSFGVKNKSSILGYDTNATPYLKYMTNGPYIDAPSEISAADYKAQVAKLRAGGEVKVKIYDFTSANVDKL